MAECSVPPMDTYSKVVELNQVFGDSLIVINMKGFEIGFSFTYGVIQSKGIF